MGRLRRYREGIEFEMQSVKLKSVHGKVTHSLQQEFSRSKLESEVLASRSIDWLKALDVPVVPGQVRLSVPSTLSRRYALTHRCEVTITAVNAGEDTEVWQEFGLAAMQRRRILRWLYEIYRQGGWASLTELAAWANLTPTALGNLLAPVRKLWIWLPHVGGPAPHEDHLALEL